MLRVVIVLFWVSLIVGTLLAHSLVANWAVTLAGLYFGARWFAARKRTPESQVAAASSSGQSAPVGGPARALAANLPVAPQLRSRWTVDKLHTGERRWR
jgi:hypothetical protein